MISVVCSAQKGYACQVLVFSMPPLSSARFPRLLISCFMKRGVISQFWFGYLTRELASTTHCMYRVDVVVEPFDHARATDYVDTVKLTDSCQLSRCSLARYSAQTITETVLCPSKIVMSLCCWWSCFSFEVFPAVVCVLLSAQLHLLPQSFSLT